MIGLTLTTIVVGYDGSPPSERALERAATLAPADASVVVVTTSPSLGRSGVVAETILDSPLLTR
jgi:nucleotide-binding universal stress UspA family protein